VKVKNWMNKKVVTISPDAGPKEAIEIMHHHSIRHLPVVENDQMLGFVTESNLRQYLLTANFREARMDLLQKKYLLAPGPVPVP